MKKQTSSAKSTACATLAGMMLLCMLTGCASATQKYAQNLNIYQPRVLTIEPGTPVQTVDGVYTAQTRETWHSDKTYRELENAYMDLTAQK